MTGPIQPAAHRSPRVWMDVTTSLRNAGSHANGTLRVERALAAGLRAELGDRIAFCRYGTAERRFFPAQLDDRTFDDAAQRPRQSTGFGAARRDTLGRRIERTIRLALRGASRRLNDRFQRTEAKALFPDVLPGDVLLLGGETWSPRYDFDVLRRLRNEGGLRIAAICQDVIPLAHPQFFASRDFVARYRAYVDWLIADVDLVIVHSRAVEADVVAQATAGGMPRPSIAVVPLGADIGVRAAPQMPDTLPRLVPDGFVIAVSTIQSRKNIDLLYRVWRRFAEDGRKLPRLVVVGARGFGSAELLAQIANDPLVGDSILVLHDATDAELAWLYRNCCFTLYPSFAEGWGLPIAESLAYGKPCLASNTTSMPEAGAGLAVHLDPLDLKAWHDTIIAWSDDAAARQAMADRIVSTYRATSWAQSAAALAARLRELLA